MKTAEYWIEKLKMTPLPEEGGMYKETYRSTMVHKKENLPERYDGDRTAITDIFYLLHGNEFSAFHKLTSDEIWHHHAGDGMLVHIISEAGDYQKVSIGSDLESGDVLSVAFPLGCWFAAEPKKTDSYGLVSCVVAPGFEFSDFELGTRAQLNELYSQHYEIINKMTRS